MKTVLLMIFSLFIVTANASTLVVGNNIGSIQLQDQFEQSYGSQENTKKLLFSRSMKGGTIIEEALTADETLHENPTLVYIADISGMPSLISRFFAIPGFQKFPFKVALDKEGTATKNMPSKDDQATLLLLEDGKIIGINYFSSKTTLLTELQQN